VLHGPQLKGPQRVLAYRPASALGRWSFGIFLWGYIVQKAVTQMYPDIPTAALLAISIAGAIALGAASWRYIEQPASQWIRTRFNARQGRSRPGEGFNGGVRAPSPCRGATSRTAK